MRRDVDRRGGGLVVAALLCLGACAGTAEPAAPARVHDGWPGCEAVGAFSDPRGGGPGSVDVGAVPSGFDARAVVICTDGERKDARGDTVSVDLERTSTDVAPLLRYLARPSQRATRGACPAMGVAVSWFYLLDSSGRYVAPATPVDACGFPLGTFDDGPSVWDGLRYTDRVVRRRDVVLSAEADEAGCSMEVKDEVVLSADDGTAHPVALERDPFGSAALRVCAYRIPAAERHDDPPVGTFASGRVVRGDDEAALVAALVPSTAGPTGCTRTATRFALVQEADRPRTRLSVELDGCRRIVVADTRPTAVAAASAHLVDLLER